VVGVSDAEHAIVQMEKEISNRISPPLTCSLDIHDINGKKVIASSSARRDPPYAVDDNKIYVRSEVETALAVRDEIVDLVQRGLSPRLVPAEPLEVKSSVEIETAPARSRYGGCRSAAAYWVEVVSYEDREGRAISPCAIYAMAIW